jgi:cyanophycinase-like exopeptidase
MNAARIRNAMIAGALVLGGASAGAVTTSHAASAAGAVYSTTSRTETLTSGTCYYEKQVTRTYYSWSSKAGHYQPLAAPRTTTTTSTHCHA